LKHNKVNILQNVCNVGDLSKKINVGIKKNRIIKRIKNKKLIK